MGFISSVVSAIVNIVVAIIIFIVDVVVQIVEVIIHLIMILLGWKPDSQTVEYFEVRNVILFDDPDHSNPLLNAALTSILQGGDLSKDLSYAQVYRSLKGNLRTFMAFIEDGNYFESFPDIESYIVYVDYDELTAALNTLNGVPCTPEISSVYALDVTSWVSYWLQENKEYDVGANLLGTQFVSVSTSPITPGTTTSVGTPGVHLNITITDEIASEDSVVVNSAAPVVTTPITPATTTFLLVTGIHFRVSIANEVATSDSVLVDERWQVDFPSVVYNVSPGTYSVPVYNASGVTRTLSYTIPAKPNNLHYISKYYRDSAPSRQYIFIYKIGTGVYTDLDTVETPLNLDGSAVKALPDIPLRISNSDYTTFGATKADKIVALCDLVDLDPALILDKVMTAPGALAGDIDNVYIKFGVRMWDTSSVGMQYLYTAFENLYAAQAVSQGIYNNTAAGNDKPVNNIITTTADSKYAFQWSYITYAFTPLATIIGNSGSTENGVYYSDLSKFNSSNLLVYDYYTSSGKGTYNVGYKADTLAEVAAFLAGNGVVNPGTTTTEGANWLQVTTRLSYNNPSPVLQDSDGTTSALKFLTGDMVFENNGSGGLKAVKEAAEQTTVGQSITYYRCTESGLDAYTVTAPSGALKVVDGDSGVFKTVRFNLANKDDLMAPFVHTFFKDRSNKDITQLFLAGAHVSIYIAHYEVIQPASMSFLTALLILIIIIVVIVLIIMFPPLAAGGGPIGALITAAVTGTVTSALVWGAFVAIVKGLLIQMLIQVILTEVAKVSPELAMVLGIVAAVGMAMYGPGASDGALTGWDYAQIAASAISNINTVQTQVIKDTEAELKADVEVFDKETKGVLETLNAMYLNEIYEGGNRTYDGLTSVKRASLNPMYPEHMFVVFEGTTTMQYTMYEPEGIINMQVSGESSYI